MKDTQPAAAAIHRDALRYVVSGCGAVAVGFHHTVVHFGPTLNKLSAEGRAGLVAFICQRHRTSR